MTYAAAELVTIRRHWSDNVQRAKVRASDLQDLHLSTQSGGYEGGFGVIAARPHLHAYVMCDAMIEGTVGHSCQHGPPPHRIKVCIVKKDNPRTTYERLLARLSWSGRLRNCPFSVDLGSPEPSGEEVSRWLTEHCQQDDYVKIRRGWWKDGWSPNWRPSGDQIWFASPEQATKFATHFCVRLLHHQNQGKQVAAETFMAARQAVEASQ